MVLNLPAINNKPMCYKDYGQKAKENVYHSLICLKGSKL
jgi:hypothetical protein